MPDPILSRIVADHLEWLRDHPPAEHEVPDVVGDFDRAVAMIRDAKSGLMAEVTTEVDGDRYRVTFGRRAERSYNTSGLLAAFGGFDHLPDLVAAGAVRLDWQWSALRKHAYTEGVDLRLAAREIDDGDPDNLIGEVWVEKPTVRPKR